MASNSTSEERTPIPSAGGTAAMTPNPTVSATSTSTSACNSNATATATTSGTTIPPTGPVPGAVRAVVRPQFLQQRHNLPPSQVQYLSSSSTWPQTQPQIQFGGKPTSVHVPVPVPVPDQLPPLRYPLASSGRGFINSSSTSRPYVQLPDQTGTASNPNPNPNPNANPASYSVSSRSVIGYHPPPPPPAPSARPFGFAPSASPPVVKGFPVSAHPLHFKVGSSPCPLADCNGGHKTPSEMGRDDVSVSVRERKVRISDGASMYALCRSWLRNGHPEESRPQLDDIVKSLPKPAPASLSDTCSPKRKDADEEEENDTDEKAVESLSTKELLQLHIKRAKIVRERLKEERLQRIARYKGRLALLLPPLGEQCRAEPSDGG